MRAPPPLSDQDRITISKSLQRHPGKSSLCGALLAEVGSSATSLDERTAAARLHGDRRCRRGLNVLDKVVWEAHASIEATLCENDGFPVGAMRNLLGATLYAIASMDSPQSHAKGLEYLFTFSNPHLRSDVLEYMAFAEVTFDTQLMAHFLTSDTPEPMVLSALYALRLNPTAAGIAATRPVIAPLLGSPSACVRAYAVYALQYSSDNEDLVIRLVDDLDPDVRDAVTDVMTWFREN